MRSCAMRSSAPNCVYRSRVCSGVKKFLVSNDERCQVSPAGFTSITYIFPVSRSTQQIDAQGRAFRKRSMSLLSERDNFGIVADRAHAAEVFIIRRDDSTGIARDLFQRAPRLSPAVASRIQDLPE